MYDLSGQCALLDESFYVLQVYLPMSYVYGVRGTCKETPLVRALR